MRQLPLALRLAAGAVFSSYLPGPNTEAVAALRAGEISPLWLWGAPGFGKTHLLQAACAAAGSGAVYLPLGGELDLPPDALAGFETQSLLCIDDVDHIAGQLNWESQLFALFNAATESGARLVFAAAESPRAIDWRLADWGSRAATAAVYQLRPLSDSERVEALRLRAAQRGLDMPPETAEYLLTHLPRDLRSLFDALDALDEAALAAQRRLTVPFIRSALSRAKSG